MRVWSSTKTPLRKMNGDDSRTRSQKLLRHIKGEQAIATGLESLVKRLRWRSKRIRRAPNHRDQRRHATKALRNDLTVYWKAITAEIERVAACGDTGKLYQVLKVLVASRQA